MLIANLPKRYSTPLSVIELIAEWINYPLVI